MRQLVDLWQNPGAINWDRLQVNFTTKSKAKLLIDYEYLAVIPR